MPRLRAAPTGPASSTPARRNKRDPGPILGCGGGGDQAEGREEKAERVRFHRWQLVFSCGGHGGREFEVRRSAAACHAVLSASQFFVKSELPALRPSPSAYPPLIPLYTPCKPPVSPLYSIRMGLQGV